MIHGVGVLLLSAVGGYWVLERAAAHKGNLKTIGQLVGGTVIVISLLGVACRVWCLAAGPVGGWCPMSKGLAGGYCPFTSKSPLGTSPSGP